MVRCRRRHLYIGGAFVAIWFLVNFAYVGKLNNDKKTQRHRIYARQNVFDEENKRNGVYFISKNSIKSNITKHGDEVIFKKLTKSEKRKREEARKAKRHRQRTLERRTQNNKNGNKIETKQLPWKQEVAQHTRLPWQQDETHQQMLSQQQESHKPVENKLAITKEKTPINKQPDENKTVKLKTSINKNKRKKQHEHNKNNNNNNNNNKHNHENNKKQNNNKIENSNKIDQLHTITPNRPSKQSVAQSDKSIPTTIDQSEHRDVVAVDDDLTPDELRDINDGYERHSFNVRASNDLPLDREVPDTRPSSCPTVRMTGLPRASVIICFHNEALTTLLRTIHSVVNRSPRQLLHEIILVDDASTYDYLGSKLEESLDDLPHVEIFIVRLRKRQGIVRARMWGVEKSSGDVLVFLDSHCECGPGWLPPLLQAVKYDRTKLACPEVDIIDHTSLSYSAHAHPHHGTFDWTLTFVWKPLSEDERKWRLSDAEPIRTPTMLGGLFAVDRARFTALGQYDPGMVIWGGENIELSFRTWMCGGSIEILPCSRVGHIFRPVIPYGFPGGNPHAVINYNSQRVAEVWMDEYKRFFYAATKARPPTSDMQDSLLPRRLLRRQLQCEDFQWFLTNVVPEIPVPTRDMEYFGQIKLEGKGECVELDQSNKLQVKTCKPLHPAQTFHLTVPGVLMRGSQCVGLRDDQSLYVTGCDGDTVTCQYKQGPVSYLLCSPPLSRQQLCLRQVTTATRAAMATRTLGLLPCRPRDDLWQRWSFTVHFDQDKLRRTW